MIKEHFWINNLRAIATLSVILLHVCATPVQEFGKTEMQTWWISNTLDGAVRFCVPVFFMLSGALLLSKDDTLSCFLKNRFLRLIPPFVFWSFVYIAFEYLVYLYYGGAMSEFEIVKHISTILYKGSSYQLWFVYTIIGLYLITPIMRRWIHNSTPKEIIYFLTIWCLTLFFNYSFLKTYKPSFELIYFSGYIGYMVLGYFLSVNGNKIINSRLFSISLITIGSSITILGTYYISMNIKSFDSTFYYYLTPNVAISAIGVFLFFKNMNITSKTYTHSVSHISKNSYGIYLIHVLILNIISRFGINWMITSPYISFFVVTIICFTISFTIIHYLGKNKIIMKIVG